MEAVIEAIPTTEELDVGTKAEKRGHTQWMDTAKERGWKLGFPRDNDEKIHFGLISFESLQAIKDLDPQKIEDRETFKATILKECENENERADVESILNDDSRLTHWMKEMGPFSKKNQNWRRAAESILKIPGIDIEKLKHLQDKVTALNSLDDIDKIIEILNGDDFLKGVAVKIHDGWRREKFKDSLGGNLKENFDNDLNKNSETTEYNSKIRILLFKFDDEMDRIAQSASKNKDAKLIDAVQTEVDKQRDIAHENPEISSVYTYNLMIQLAKRLKERIESEENYAPNMKHLQRANLLIAYQKAYENLVYNLAQDTNEGVIDLLVQHMSQ